MRKAKDVFTPTCMPINMLYMSLSAAMGDGFIARDITFVNSAGPAKQQAVALRVEIGRAHV